MSQSKAIRFTFASDDSRADGLDPWALNEKCIKGSVSGLESKTVVDVNDGERVVIELYFNSRDALIAWFDANVDRLYYPIALQI